MQRVCKIFLIDTKFTTGMGFDSIVFMELMRDLHCEASIEAALHPEKTDYLYFVADGTGGHAFAATLEEHNRNVAAWRKIEAERGQAGQGGVQEGD